MLFCQYRLLSLLWNSLLPWFSLHLNFLVLFFLIFSLFPVSSFDLSSAYALNHAFPGIPCLSTACIQHSNFEGPHLLSWFQSTVVLTTSKPLPVLKIALSIFSYTSNYSPVSYSYHKFIQSQTEMITLAPKPPWVFCFSAALIHEVIPAHLETRLQFFHPLYNLLPRKSCQLYQSVLLATPWVQTLIISPNWSFCLVPVLLLLLRI